MKEGVVKRLVTGCIWLYGDVISGCIFLQGFYPSENVLKTRPRLLILFLSRGNCSMMPKTVEFVASLR